MKSEKRREKSEEKRVCDAINVFCEGTVTFVGTTFTVVRNSIRNLITPSLILCYVKVRENSEKTGSATQSPALFPPPSVKNSHPDVFEFTWHFVTTGEVAFSKKMTEGL